ncbi:odorant receptor 4 isoform X1 [Halyomorpha halys]|uniref:odorant receptor 4 isoform X1 n=1 Tax=Halyomorpha halys TaxID=286706 RepID=UPI0034D34D2C|nr:Odorant receptor 80 [Halyomorpha halys]
MVKILKSLLQELPGVLEITFVISRSPVRRFIQAFVTITNVVMSIANAVSLYFLGLERSLGGTASFAAYGIIICIKHAIYYFRENEIKQLLGFFAEIEKRHKKGWEKEMFEKISKDAWNVVYKYWMIILPYEILYINVLTLLDFVIGYVIPNFPSIRVDVPCEGFIEFFEPRTLKRFIITVPILIWTMASMTVHLGSETLVFISIIYTKIELRIIRKKLEMIKNYLEKKEDDYKIKSEKMLWKVIAQHQRTIEVLNNMKGILGLPVAIHNTAISVTLCVIFYCLMTFDERGSLSIKFHGITLIMCCGSLVLGLCYFGESMEEENNEVICSIYDLPWYSEGKNFRRTVAIMLMQAQKPFVIKYRGLATLNLKTFMQIMNASYSYLMMLKSTV